MKKLPQAVDLLICEDIRHEQYNKNTIIGLHGSRIIIREEDATVPQLVFVQRSSDGEGKFDLLFKLIAPNGDEVASVKGLLELKPQTRDSLFSIKLAPFKFKGPGTYRVEITLDEQKWVEHEFEVELGDIEEYRWKGTG